MLSNKAKHIGTAPCAAPGRILEPPKALGLDVPPTLLARADEVIE